MSELNHSPLSLFISHSSRDVDLAARLVDLVRSALNLRSSQIRCTSVDGYRLPGGANTDQQLRAEVHDAKTFLGIISAASLESMYVMFELGARWGAGKHLLPLLAPDVGASALRGPLAGITALSLESAAQLHQLVQDLGNILSVNPEPPSSFLTDINSILALTSEPEQLSPKDGQLQKVLELIVQYRSQGMSATPAQFARDLGLDPKLVLEYMWGYHNDQFITFENEGRRPELDTSFFLSPKGWERVGACRPH
ncbi:MAG: toll/interleukin-1 receptor domain-containing protein [Candidatus Binatia bacterium]